MTSLLHQKWKDLYDIGIVLQYSYGSSNSWHTVNYIQTTKCLSFNSVDYKYRISPDNTITKKMYITKDNIIFHEVLGFNNNGWYIVAGDRGKKHCNPMYYTLSVASEIKDIPMYEYLPIEQIKVGSVVQFINKSHYRDIPTGSLHIVDSVIDSKNIICNTISKAVLQSDSFKLIKTKPGYEAKTGDMIIRFKDGTSTMPTGGVFKAKKVMPTSIYYTETLSANINECLVLCTKEPEYTLNTDTSFTDTNSYDYYINFKELTEQNKTIEEKPMQKILDLSFLSTFMTITTAEVKDATNSELVIIKMDNNGNYSGYFYADSEDEIKEVVARPENEGAKFYTFKFSTVFSQRPRKVVEVTRG